ncbi:MAG: metallophosphoesterase, partial [Armatimonadetes bacterium]|nr:metallophosphoesterase [Armatimonadota bacterium]
FRVTHLELDLPGWPAVLDGLTILHATDLHTRRHGPAEEFLRRVAEELDPPDLVVFTGDFAEGRRGILPCLAALEPLQARLGRFAVLGNNDLHSEAHRLELVHGLETQGIRVLTDQAVRLEQAGTAFQLGGAAFVHLRRADVGFSYPVERVFAGLPADEPRILLAHSPDLVPEAAGAGVRLLLAGHTHGGQICLPGGRPVRSNLYRFRLPHFTTGLAEVGPMAVYVNRGLGTTGPPLRAWCPPEVALLTLRPG